MAQGESYVIDLMEVKKFHNMGIKGQGVKVAVVDSGFQQHEDLVFKGGYNAYNDNNNYTYDPRGHGTRVAGVIGMQDNNIGYLGIAPECDLYGIKVGDYDNNDVPSQVRAMTWAMDNNMDIISCSFSSLQDDPARREIFKLANDHGIIICCSAGNRQTGVDLSEDTLGYPARYPFVFTCANLTSSGERAGSSSVGSQLNFTSGGTDIPTTTTDSSRTISRSYRTASGTSYATPAIAGMFALYKQMYPHDSKDKIVERMYENARNIGDKWLFGAGIPQFPKEYKNVQIRYKG